MPPLAVDPTALTVAGVSVAAVGDGLNTAVSMLTGSFTANTGQDAAGVMFGRQYENTARDLLKAVAAGVNACEKTGYGIQVSAVNYSRAEAQSDISGRAQPLPSPPCPAPVSAAGAPSAEGPGVLEPTLWKVVEFLVGDLWPNGDPAAMRTAAAAWRTFGGSLCAVTGDMAGPYNAISAQQLPEAELIKAPIRDIGTAFSALGGSCQQVATQLDGFAADVEKTQNAIRDLLSKLGSVGGIAGMFFEFFKGHGEDELHKIADDVKTVMSHLESEASAKRAGVQQAEQNVDTWVRALEKSANREFTEFFGDHVGQVLSMALNTQLDSPEAGFRWLVGNAEGIEDMNPLRFAYDPDGALQTWKGISDLSSIVTNPAPLVQMALKDPAKFESIIKGLARTHEWSKDRPMLGATQNILDILTLPFVLGKAGEAADIASAARRASTTLEGNGGSIGIFRAEVGETGRLSASLDNIAKGTPQISKGFEGIGDKPPVVEPPAGGRPVPAPDAVDPPPSIASPLQEKPAAPQSLPSETSAPTASTPPSAQHAAAPVEHGPPSSASSVAPAQTDPRPTGGTGASSSLGAPPHPVDAPLGGGKSAPVQDFSTTSADEHASAGGAARSDDTGAQHDVHQREGVGHDDGAAGDSNSSQNGVADHSQVSGEVDGPGIDEQQRDAILAMEKGSRPDPLEYLSPEYVEHHLERFDGGATRFMTAQNLEAFGIGQRDGTTFVFPRSELDALMESTGGDRGRLEQALGLPDGYFSAYDVVRVDVPDPRHYDLRMPSGNEAGANDKWIPGGFLPEGMPEAVIDGGNVPSGDISVTDISKKPK